MQFSTVLKPSDGLDLYIASLMVGCSWEATLTSQAASVLLKNPCAQIGFIHRAQLVAHIHGCCSWNIVQHIVNVTWSPWASVAVHIMSLLNARNFILINPLMSTIPIVLFRCKTQRSTNLYQISIQISLSSCSEHFIPVSVEIQKVTGELEHFDIFSGHYSQSCSASLLHALVWSIRTLRISASLLHALRWARCTLQSSTRLTRLCVGLATKLMEDHVSIVEYIMISFVW